MTWREIVTAPIASSVKLHGPIGAGPVEKLMHTYAGYDFQVVLAEVLSMGIKARIEPLALCEAGAPAPAHVRPLL